MFHNEYDNFEFFNKYKDMKRSIDGLEAAGEWHEFRKMLPDIREKNILDLGCGFGWHCRYFVDEGAKFVIGVDLSKNMLDVAKQKTNAQLIEYLNMPIEDFDYQENFFDIVISSLVFHYIEDFDSIIKKIKKYLKSDGLLIFSVEHPIFTSIDKQDWYYDELGNPIHWPIDYYFDEGIRKTIFLEKRVIKYHRTLTTYINTLILNEFDIVKLVEPIPPEHLIEDMKDEIRRPMMLLIKCKKR